MLKEAMQYIVNELAPVKTISVDGELYADRKLSRIKDESLADAIRLHSLKSLVDYLNCGLDSFKNGLFIHIISPTEVSVFSGLNKYRDRETVINVTPVLPDFRFGTYYDHESFCINMQTKYVDDDSTDKKMLLKFAGTVEAGTVAEYGDDGVTQKATIKTGIASKGDALIPSPVTLAPYRTFLEVSQPCSEFVFRMKQSSDGNVQCALFEADGGAWKLEAIANIEEYLRTNLDPINDNSIVILA